MSGFAFQPVQMPDFGATLARSQAFGTNQLLALSQMRQLQELQAKEEAYSRYSGDLASTDPAVRMQAYSQLARFSPQAFMEAIQNERDRNWDAGLPTNQGGAPIAAPGGGAAPSISVPSDAPAPSGDDVRARNAYFAQQRAAVLNNPNLTPEQVQAALARLSAAQAGAGGTPERPGGYRDAPWAVGTAPPSGTVNAAPTSAAPATYQGLIVPPGWGRADMDRVILARREAARGNPIAKREWDMYVQTVGMQPPPDRDLVPIRRPDGSTVMVPRPQAAGAVSAPDAPPGYRFASNGQLERIPGGPAESSSVREDFANTRQLREEFNASQAAKDLAQSRPNVDAIRRAIRTDSRAADIDMVFAFAKLLDPNSVVREGEQLQLMRTGGVFDTVQGWINGLAGGQRLTPEVRQSIATQAEARWQSYAAAHDERLTYYRGLAEQNGFRPDQIGRFAVERAPTTPEAGGTSSSPRDPLPRPATPAEAARLPSGTRFLGPDGRERIRP